MSARLQLHHVSRSFQGPAGMVRAVEGVSLKIEAGELVVVQGPSGCGKTTLLLAAGGLLQPGSGQILINGQDPYGLSGAERARFRARQVGFVFQQFHLVPFLSVLDNILAPSLALPSPDALDRARSLAARFGLLDRCQHVPAELSTGERQRVALARALLNQPGLLLADEPTGNLDPENARTVLGCLVEFARGGGAVLLVTHDPAASQYARQTLHLQGGRLVS